MWGNIVETRDYDPFGRTIGHTGDFALKHRFTGQPEREAAGMNRDGLWIFGKLRLVRGARSQAGAGRELGTAVCRSPRDATRPGASWRRMAASSGMQTRRRTASGGESVRR
jgi:hypothetical protein